ncbi:MAG: 50S ribosomal protein L3 [Candidatus Niyogibacteria bacterium]|nr:50S ribosomal protein L3 [Candidatus Niyogibacteria bacterium]
MAFILGKKVNMTQFFTKAGIVRPVTLVESGPMIVTQVKTAEKDGYDAVQVGFGRKNPKRIPKPVRGQWKAIPDASFRWVREFRVSNPSDFNVGDAITASVFNTGDKVKVSAISKGKGFQGVVKRHGFHGGSRTHGQKHSEREAGSIGGGGRAGGRVAKGMRMAGRMGGERVTVRNLEIVFADAEKNLVAVSGAIPGRRDTLVEIRKII